LLQLESFLWSELNIKLFSVYVHLTYAELSPTDTRSYIRTIVSSIYNHPQCLPLDCVEREAAAFVARLSSGCRKLPGVGHFHAQHSFHSLPCF